MDTLPADRRSALMKRVKQSNTRPEMTLRRELHRLGFRYIIGDRRLPGTPDLVLPRYRTAIFVHGCFWHGHACRQGRAPSSNLGYWLPKIAANQERDLRKKANLEALGWHVITVWECELRITTKNDTVGMLSEALRSILKLPQKL
jgi:DNA mismatch endonuclease (patch repair protein)